MAFDYFIFKVASRCNLNCSYCYIYNLADQSWQLQPRFMSLETITAAARRIVEHCQTHGQDYANIVLHGGEPLLMGIPRIQQLIDILRELFSANSIRYRLAVQTNATLISYEWMEFFNQNHVAVGVSLDGPRHIHNQYRVDPAGKGSYDDVIAGIELINQHGQTPSVLFVVNLKCDPVVLLDEFASLGIRAIDFNLPDANHQTLPPDKHSFDDTSYGDWLIRLFDYWYSNDQLQLTIRSFKSMIVNLMNKAAPLQKYAGNIPAIIETNGDMEPLDAFKSAAEGFTKTGLNVHTHSFDDLDNVPLITKMRLGLNGVHATCKACRYLAVCGGGQPHHRYDAAGGIDNPDVYCKDLYKLYVHIEMRLYETIGLAQPSIQ